MANNWVMLTDADVLSALNVMELTSYRQSRDSDEKDPLGMVLDQVVSEVRGACLDVPLLPQEGIPKSLMTVALDIVVYRLAKRLHLNTEAQRWPAAERAMKRLDLVRAGDLRIEDPDQPLRAASTGSSQVVIYSEQVRTIEALEGL